MSANKTQPTEMPVAEYIAAIEHPVRRANSETLDRIFRKVTGWEPVMWGPSLIGYGRYDYVYDSGRSGSSLATGFAPRKTNLALHIMPGYADFGDIMDRLGKHKTGAACVYINKLADVDEAVVAELIAAGLKNLKSIYPVFDA